MIVEASKPLVPVWRTVRQLLPVYAGMAQRFDLPAPPFDLAQIDQNNDHDAMLRIAEWLELIDDSSQPHHLRSALQEIGAPVSDLCLQIWIQHFVSKPVKTSCDRDKIDFLLVQYLCLNMPPSLQDRKPTRAEITAVLEPVLGACDGGLPDALGDLDVLLGIAERCQSLQEFEQNAIIPHGRELKFSAGDLYFTAPYLLAFTHFNAVVRGECLRLMNADLKFIGEGLQQLQRQGVQSVDCSAAGWSDREPLFELKKKWATWELASGDYSTDFYTALIGFRTAVEDALTPSIERSINAIWDEMSSIRSVLVSMQTQIQDLARTLSSISSARPSPPVASPQEQRATSDEPRTSDPASRAVVEAVRPRPAKPAPAVQAAVVPPAAPPNGKASIPPAPPANGNGSGYVAAPAATIPPEAVIPPPVVPPPAAPPAIPTPPPVVTESSPPRPVTSETAPLAPSPAAAELPVVAPAANEAAELPHVQEIPVEVVVEKAAPAAPQPSLVAATQTSPQPAAPAHVPEPPPAPPAAADNRQQPTTDSRPPATDKPATDNRQPAAESQPSTESAPLAEIAAANLNDGIVKVQKILAGNGKRSAAISIAVAGTRVLLTPAEVAMFSDRESACAGIVQRAVVARLYLVSALETYSKTRNKTNLTPLIALAKAEQSSLTTAVAECKAKKRGRDEEILAATGKQLAAMLERAGRIAR